MYRIFSGASLQTMEKACQRMDCRWYYQTPNTKLPPKTPLYSKLLFQIPNSIYSFWKFSTISLHTTQIYKEQKANNNLLGTGGGEAATPKKRGAGGKAKGTPKSQAAVEDDDETLSGLGELDEESPAKKKGALNRVKNARVAKKCSPKKKEIDITTKIKSEMVDDDDDGEYYHDGRAAQAEADEADGFDQSYGFQ